MKDQKYLFPRKGGGGRGKIRPAKKSSKSSPANRAKSTAKKFGASETFVNSRGSRPIRITGTGSTSFAYAQGGGKRIVLGKTSAFSGREAGGGSRSTVYGTSHFGSGYPYGGYGLYVSSRPLPYYYYPVPCYHNYYGGDEYLNVSDYKRPGGNLVTALIQPSYNTSSVTYRIVGDNSSVVAVFDALVSNCSVANSSLVFARFEPPKTWPLPEQVIQYYRASSFALSLDGYNNTATLPSNAPPSNQSQLFDIPDTPLPSGLNGTFLQCVNQTIGASVPLAEPGRSGLSHPAIGGIVGGSIVGSFLLCVFACCCHISWKERKQRKVGKAGKSLEANDVPAIHVDSGDAPAYTPAYTKDFDEKGNLAKSRPASIDEGTLVADSSSRKERWSYASSSASSRSDLSDSADIHPPGKVDNQSGQDNPSEPKAKKSSWSSRVPFIRRFNRSGKHQSTSSVHELLTDVPRHSREVEDNRGRRDSRSLSPSHSPYSSRSPSPSPSTAKFPLTSGEEKRSPG